MKRNKKGTGMEMLETGLVSSLEKIGEGLAAASPGRRLYLSALQGETVSFQIVIPPLQEDGAYEGKKASRRRKMKVDARVSGEAENIKLRIRQVLPVMCRRSCDPDSLDEDYLFYDARMAPDLLRDLPGSEIWQSESRQSLWVDVRVGENCSSGEYRVLFSISGEDGEGLPECEALVRVQGTCLPKLQIPHTEWFHCDAIADYYGVEVFSGEFWRIFRNFLEVYVKRGGNMILTPVITPPLDTERDMERTTVQLVGVEITDEGYRLDFTQMERFLDICLECGIRYFEICHLFTQWGAAAAPKVVARTKEGPRRIFGWDTPSDDPGYLAFLGVLLPAVRKLLSGRGLLERTFFHISDEPDLKSVRYRTAQSAVRGLLEGCTIVEAVSDYEYYGRGLVDIPVCATNHIEPFLEKRPDRLWTYYCCAQTQEVPNRFISMPSWRNRIYGILLYWHGIDGFLHWGFNFYNSGCSRKRIDPYETVDGDESYPAGDPFLVYPGEGGIPEESIRIMVQEEAIADYRALTLLESRIGRQRVLELIRQEAGMELSFRQYPRNAEFILRLREKVNRMLA